MPTHATRRYKVLVADFITGPLDPERSVLGELADVEAVAAHTEQDLHRRVEDAHALMIYHTIAITRQTIDRLECCKLIVRCGVGYDNIDCAAARARGIPVANVPDYGTEEVADTALGLALSLVRGINLLNSRLRAGVGEWSFQQAVPMRRLRGRVFGIVGLGRIGTATALRAKALGMDVAFYDPYVPDGRDKALGIRRCETLEELLRQSWVLSLHCPLTAETRHMLNAESMRLMPRGGYLVNTARGAVVDTAAVPAVLAEGHLAGVALDVLPEEPPAAGDPLVAAWRDPQHPAHHRLILNPHAAFYCEEGLTEMRLKGSEACRRALLGLPLRNVVN
ncbi:MAG: C-terminal binding protein [Pirellulales bacterium]|nr:C-terminal binding protein [Pirellulales bacterium]